MRRYGALLAQALQRARPLWAGGGDALGAAADLHRRGAQRRYRCGAVAARRVGPAVCVVDPGPLGGLLGREGHRHEAQPGEPGAAGRGAKVAPGRDLVRGAGGPGVRAQKGAIERLYTAPPEGGVVVCLDEMGPQSARSYPGRRVVKPAPPQAQRAKQEIDYGRRGKGYVFGAFRPATGEAFTETYAGRTTANWVDFLGQVERWIDAGVERVYAVLDNLNVHSATDVLLFALAHPRWEFVFQHEDAAYRNVIVGEWKVLRSLDLKGR